MCLATQDTSPTEHSLADRQQIADVVALGGGQIALESRVCRLADLVLALPQGRHVFQVARIGELVVELDQQGLEADPQLQRRLALAAGVEVGAGAQQQRLAGVQAFLPAEYRGDPFLRAQVFLTPPPFRGAAGPDVDLAGSAETPAGGLFAAAVADSHRHGALGRQLVDVGIGARDRVGVEGAVEQLDPFADEDVGGVLGPGRPIEPALRLGLTVERRKGPDRRRPGERQLGRLGIWNRAPRPPAPARGGRWRPDSPYDEDALALAAGPGPSQIAPVRQWQRAGEVELRESE